VTWSAVELAFAGKTSQANGAANMPLFLLQSLYFLLDGSA
jgi:hypothetical protein